MRHAAKLGNLALLAVACGAHLAAQTPTPPGSALPASPPAGAPTIKVDVNLVLVEVSVRDGHGHAVGNLQPEDFRVLEDGAEQPIRTFSHEELPLAVALVLDSSSSIAAALDELRAGGLDTLSLLKPDDEVALYSFAMQPELVSGLTTNRQAIAEDLWALSPGGGTDINDALYEAALYLGRTAGDRRHAAILVSDNEPSERGEHDVRQVARAALDSGTPIYSIKVGYLEHSKRFFLTHPEAPLHDVEKICHATGGEMIDTRRGSSVTSAMKTILTWLQQGYTLGYTSPNFRQDGAYRRIEVRLTGRHQAFGHKCTISARQGYYAPAAH